MVLLLEEVKEELIISEEMLQQVQANNAELKAKKALLEQNLQEQTNQNQEAENFRASAANAMAEKVTATRNKESAATQNNESLAELKQANQNIETKKESVENLKSSVNSIALDVTRTKNERTQAQNDKSTAENRQATEQTMPVTTAFRKAQVAQPRKQKELISSYSNSALSELSVTVNSMLSVQDELDRLFVDQTQPAVWTNIAQDKRRYDSNAFRAYQQKTNLSQIGMQKVLDNRRIGAIFSHSRSDNTFDE